jgi:hypothetical protein
MKQIIIYLLLLTMSISISIVHCQPYRSIFSKEITQWNVYECAADAGGTFAYYSSTDTIIDSKVYKILYKEKIYSPTQKLGTNGYKYGYLREDTINGKCWILKGYDNKHIEILLMDLSLTKGDLFHGVNSNLQIDSALVDTVYYENNRKIVEINKLHGDCRNVYKTQFIEGVGATSGFEEIGKYSLICKFNGSSHIFSTQSDFLGTCFIEGAADVKSTKINNALSLYPNPVQNILTIKLLTSEKQLAYIYNFQGKEIYRFYTQSTENKLNISDYKSGIYLLKIGSEVCKFSKQ